VKCGVLLEVGSFDSQLAFFAEFPASSTIGPFYLDVLIFEVRQSLRLSVKRAVKGCNFIDYFARLLSVSVRGRNSLHDKLLTVPTYERLSVFTITRLTQLSVRYIPVLR
jgi:hypothetical protein